MKRAMLAGLAVLALSAEVASAQVAQLEVVFATVDAVEVEARTLRVTGIAQGEMAPKTVTLNLTSWGTSSPIAAEAVAQCERKALLAMSKPGQYLFAMKQQYSGSYPVCGLSRVSP